MTDVSQTTVRPVVVVERALAILDVLADAPQDLGTNEIARRTGITPSSASRMLATLAKGELVRRVPDTGRYRLGLRLVQLANSALSRIDLRDVAHPHLVALMEVTGETATLSVPGEGSAMTLDFVQSSSSVRSVAEIGRPSVPHATAIGKVYLSLGGTLPDGRLTAYTDRTITSRSALSKALVRIRERGWAEAFEEREPGLNAIAAPVLDADQRLVAILGLQGPAWRFDAAAMERAVGPLLDNAAPLSPGSPA
ncbi:MAG: helix-turn-helix domain-containing protein [Propionibacteriales bacterium]|nr:helix-turn-helix domain-containing protein [Propionibacteriales bacterium]